MQEDGVVGLGLQTKEMDWDAASTVWNAIATTKRM